jgi:hypothetical protein
MNLVNMWYMRMNWHIYLIETKVNYKHKMYEI